MLPFTEEMLLKSPSGDLFGLSQNAGMGWEPSEVGRKQFLILSTQGGLRAADGKPLALGYHTAIGRSDCWWRSCGGVSAAKDNSIRRLLFRPV